MDQDKRIVVLIDMDCFYCQVEEKLNPELKEKPIAVVQYNPWKGGGIIAVNYVARARGVTRHMRGDEAKEKCPEIQLPSVPCLRGKADISKYRDAGKEVAKVLQKFTPLLERASIDEAYLDITVPVTERLKSMKISTINMDLLKNTYALGYNRIEDFVNEVHSCSSDSIDFDYEHAKQLLVGAIIVTEIRSAVYEQTGYRCSAGIAHNKILAKLVCGMNKPNKQTVLPKHSVNILYRTLPVKKVKHLGGKFGLTVCEVLKINNMSELQAYSEKDLQMKFDEKNGTWLYNIARGIDGESVQARFNPKSIGCCKQLRGKSALQDLDSLKKWLIDLGDEIEDRLEKDALETNRTPKQMVVSFTTQLPGGRDTSSSRSYNFLADDDLCGEFFSNKALEIIMESTEGKVKNQEDNRKLKAPITFLGISVGKFEDICESKKTRKIMDFFGSCSLKNETFNGKNDGMMINNNKGKDFIMQKFLNTTDTTDNMKQQIAQKINMVHTTEHDNMLIASTLDKQESFFANFLNTKSNIPDMKALKGSNVNGRTSPNCTVVNRGDDSNDTVYSTSTINEEINKSIALFEEDPLAVDRVSNMRQLLSYSNTEIQSENNPEYIHTKDLNINGDTSSDAEINKSSKSIQPNHPYIGDTFQCTECGKYIAVNQYDTHADYHIALKFRDEERQQRRKEIRENRGQKILSQRNSKTTEESISCKNESVPSISSFLVKVDSSIPIETCPECNKRVPMSKLAEHMDFHEAQKLNRELNKKTTPSCLTKKNVKRKRNAGSPIKKVKLPCRSIDSFFR